MALLLAGLFLISMAVFAAPAPAQTPALPGQMSDYGWIDPFAVPADIPSYAPQRSKEPSLGPYSETALRTALERYRGIEAAGGWPRVPNGEKITLGSSDNRVAIMRERLEATGDLQARSFFRLGSADAPAFDETLHAAVMRFQLRHGLKVDGIVGPRTLAAMNVPVSERVRQLERNLRRITGLAAGFAGKQLVVNIAGQEVEAIEDGALVMRKRVVVGMAERRTPELTSAVNWIAFNPYWTVPLSIARKDIIPKAQKDPGYLTRKGIRVFSGWGPDATELDPYSVDWWSPSARNLRLRQDPSPRNSLGSVKIHFPNSEAVYLHDTPAQALFSRSARAYSSGCVRVEGVRELVAWLLEGNGWSLERVNRAIETRERKDVGLVRSVPITMIYLTAWAHRDGTVHFRNDIYGKDGLA